MIPSSLLLQNWFQQYQLELARAAPQQNANNNRLSKVSPDSNSNDAPSQKMAASMNISPIASPKSNCPLGIPMPPQVQPVVDQMQLYQNLVAELLQCRNQPALVQSLASAGNTNTGTGTGTGTNESLIAETLTQYFTYLVAMQQCQQTVATPSPRPVSPDMQAAAAWSLPQHPHPSNFVNHLRPDSFVHKLGHSHKSKSPEPVPVTLPHGIDTILKTEGAQCSPGQQSKDMASSMLEGFNALLNIDLPKSLVLRTTMPNRAAPFLINGLMHNVANATNLGLQFGVFCNQSVIDRGTRFGPFRGRIRHILSLLSQQRHYISKKLHQFQHQLVQQQSLDGDCSLLDAVGSPLSANNAANYSNWMLFVRCARSVEEANLIAFQNGVVNSGSGAAAGSGAGSTSGFSQLEIYYEALADIPKDTELVVWYGDLFLHLVAKLETLQTNPVTQSAELQDGSNLSNANANSDSALTERNQKKQSKVPNVPVSPSDSSNVANAAANTGVVNSNESYQCERCGKVFAYKYYRDKHLKFTKCVDQGDRKFPCHLCARSFEKRDRLRIHILHVHEKHRPHKCLVCGKCFSQSSSLNKHLRVHTGDRPYRCLYCGKAFTASSILRTHVRLHSGERPFKCKYCGKAFASHAAHDSHIRRTHSSGSRTNELDATNANPADQSKLPPVSEDYSEVEIDDDEQML